MGAPAIARRVHQPPQRQRRIPGHRRKPMGTCVEERVEKAIQQTMRMFNASRSFVMVVAMADGFGIKLSWEDRYDGPRPVRRANRRKK